ncbi:MAG: DUF4395 domain-containing protein [Anaerolineae bacterium]|nr:DUF4395 domain-containing protein [Anaerolineae bacterium]
MDRLKEPTVDRSLIKVGQGSMISLLIVAYVLDIWPLVAIVAVINMLGALRPRLSLWRLLYGRLLKPSGFVKPNVIPDHPEPHRFAQGVGATLATISAILLALGLQTAGWTVIWILIFLAGLNLFLGFCVGCFVYYQLNRLGIRGFNHSSIEER